MQDIVELERRITAAMERITYGLERRVAESQVTGAGVSTDEVAQLTEALDEERMANAQLTERQRVHRDREVALANQVTDLTAQLAALQAARTEEAAELADILAALNPLIEEANRHA